MGKGGSGMSTLGDTLGSESGDNLGSASGKGLVAGNIVRSLLRASLVE